MTSHSNLVIPDSVLLTTSLLPSCVKKGFGVPESGPDSLSTTNYDLQ